MHNLYFFNLNYLVLKECGFNGSSTICKNGGKFWTIIRYFINILNQI